MVSIFLFQFSIQLRDGKFSQAFQKKIIPVLTQRKRENYQYNPDKT